MSRMPAETSWWQLSTTLGVAVLLRLASVLFFKNYRHPQTWEFGEQAREIYAGHGYTKVLPTGMRVPSAHMPPFYPWFLNAMWRLFGPGQASYLAIELLQVVLGLLLVLVVYRLGQILASDTVALTAASIIAAWPSFVYLCNEFHSINIYILLGTAAVYFLVRLNEAGGGWKDTIGLGLCLGGLLLCRAEAVVLMPCYMLMMVWRRGRSAAGKAVVASLISLACLAPWTMRNYRVFGRIVLVSTSGGFNLWVGHNAFATGNSDYTFSNLEPRQRALINMEANGGEELAANRLYRQFALEHLRKHPRKEAWLAVKKLLFFAFFDPTHKKGGQIGYWLLSLVLTALSGYGMWMRRRELLGVYLPLTFTICFSLILAVCVFTLPRYRIAIDPFLALFAACTLLTLRKRLMLR